MRLCSMKRLREMYFGDIANKARDGFGTLIHASGDSYQGIFKDGKAEGLVLVTKADGSQSVETWADGEKQE